jgi:uncharacterized protein
VIHLAIIKSTRACNLRCPYCYYINEDTQHYGQMMSDQTIESLYSHLAKYLAGKSGFGFVWHGGEPLLLGKKRFQRFLDLQKKYFSSNQIVNLLQTNGVLIDQSWIDFFNSNGVSVGISLDGMREAHDRNRPTTAGKGTYDSVLRAIRLFQANSMAVCTLAVADGRYDGYETLRHFQELGIQECDFLIPMTNNALQEEFRSSGHKNYTDFSSVSAFLIGAFRRWVENAPPIGVRLFESLIQNSFGLPHGYLNAGSTNLSESLVLETNGDICLDTDFWHIDRYNLGAKYNLRFNVHSPDFSLAGVEEHLQQFIVQEGLDRLPDACQQCRVRSVCHGSHPASRFGSDGSFNHRSAYCSAFYELSDEILNYMARRSLTPNLYDLDLKNALTYEPLNAP